MPYKDKKVKRAYDRKRFLLNKEIIQNYKVENGCKDCGYNTHHAGLEFDHIRDKTTNVSTLLNGTLERVMQEIEKCEVVCGTCHNIRTFNRRENMVPGVG